MTEEIFRASAPAKVNLSLRVVRKRKDGFHELETRMCPISLCDEVSLDLKADGGASLSCDDPTLPTGEGNLAIKAVRAFETATGKVVHGDFEITKRIPAGAGMGGGSSDAAAVLRLLNDALDTKLPTKALSKMAATIGSDVPFFLYGTTCDASGRGEIIRPVEFTHELQLLLVKPPFGVPTPWAYSKWKDSIENPNFDYSPQELEFGTLTNDLERPVFEKYPVLGDLKRWLGESDAVTGSLMSGSGATVFAVLNNGANADELAGQVRHEFGDTFWTEAVRTIG